MPTSSGNRYSMKPENNDSTGVQAGPEKGIDRERKPLSKESRTQSSKTVTVHANKSIDEEEEYLNDSGDRFETDESLEEKLQNDKNDDAVKEADNDARNENDANPKYEESKESSSKHPEAREPLKEAVKTQNFRNQNIKRQNGSRDRSVDTKAAQKKGRNEPKNNVTALRQRSLPSTRNSRYSQAQARIDNGRDRATRYSMDAGKPKNPTTDRRQSNFVDRDKDVVDTEYPEGYRFNEESESFDVIDYRDEWEESPDDNVSRDSLVFVLQNDLLKV